MLCLFILLVFTFQIEKPTKIRHLTILDDNYNSELFDSYIFHIIKNQELEEGNIDCIKSELMATGFFKDIEVKVDTFDQFVDISIKPTWKPKAKASNLVIEEIDIEGFSKIDPLLVKQKIAEKGFTVGKEVTYLRDIERAFESSIEEIYSIDYIDNNGDDILEPYFVKQIYISPGKIKYLFQPLPEFCNN
jgi:hypothetical protein